ncbi:hypothetical protein MJM28_30625, partial [Salmonella enterica subsp. enterica serovar Montevideo]|nr:hypothetical protein [Salmonella enterica subsp. enterica serovar Montevideo]
PEDHWVNIWTGEAHHGGEITVDAPIGKPPVFYRAKSEWASLFYRGQRVVKQCIKVV